jgi:hypothetical protein
LDSIVGFKDGGKGLLRSCSGFVAAGRSAWVGCWVSVLGSKAIDEDESDEADDEDESGEDMID